MTACPDHLIGTVVSLALAIRVIGGSIGYSIYFNIFSNKLTASLPTTIAEYAASAGLPATSLTDFVTTFLTNPTAIMGIDGVTAQVIAAATRGSRIAYSEAFYWVWITSIAFGAVSVLACLALPSNYKFLVSLGPRAVRMEKTLLTTECVDEPSGGPYQALIMKRMLYDQSLMYPTK
jgi:hypothetical protein